MNYHIPTCNLTQMNELLGYSISDLVSCDINDYKKLFNEDSNCNSGVSIIIENRLCYNAVYDLTMYPLNLQNEMTFFKLIKFYKFIFQQVIVSFFFFFVIFVFVVVVKNH